MKSFLIFGIFSAVLLNLVSSSPVNLIGLNDDSVDSLTEQAGRKGLYQGDILFNKDGKVPMIGTNGVTEEELRWPNKTMPYKIDSSFSSKDVSNIREGIKLLTSQTCIKIQERKNEENYILIKKGRKNSGCYSYVGYIQESAQDVNLEASSYCTKPFVVAHELMHALGVHHEFARPDRDDFIEIKWENMDPNAVGNFEIPEDVSTLNVKYDYASVMHYGRRAASKNGKEVMVPKNNQWKGEFGNEKGPTPSDIQGLKIMYKC